MLIVDKSPFYGGHQHSNFTPLTLEGLYRDSTFIEEHFRELLNSCWDKKFLLDFTPIILSTAGILCKRMIDWKMSEYLQFRPVQRVSVMHSDQFTIIPTSKEDIFTDTSLSLVEKRQLSKLVTSFEATTPSSEPYIRSITNLSNRLVDALFHGILLCDSESEKSQLSVEGAVDRLRLHRDGIGRYASGTSPYLYPIYGSSEVIQSFCRYCAVNGGTFIMGQDYNLSDKHINGFYEDLPWSATFDAVVVNALLEECHRAIIITDEPLMNEASTNAWIFLNEGKVVKALCTGSDTSCAPSSFYIVHVWSVEEKDLGRALEGKVNLPGYSKHQGLPDALYVTYFKGPKPVFGVNSEKIEN